MDFRFSQDALDLQAAARDFFGGECPPERLRRAAQGDEDKLALWPKLAEMGFLGAGVSEAAGGLGLSFAELSLLCEEAGRACLPEPFSETAAVIAPLLERLGGEAAARAGRIAAGEERAALVHHRLHPFANHAAAADVVIAFQEDGLALADAGEVMGEALASIDPLRKLARVVPAPNARPEPELERFVTARAAVAAAAELCGLSDAMIQMAVAYAHTREQFGKPIGSFQAVKHLLANAQVKLEFARPAVYRAAASADGRDARADAAVAHAKIAASDAAMLAAENAHQVFGGMGYTYEADLHFYMKRAWVLTAVWGDRNRHVRTLEDAVIGGGVALGPGASFA